MPDLLLKEIRFSLYLGADTLMSTFFSDGPAFNIPPFQTTSASIPTITINATAHIALLAAPLPSPSAIISLLQSEYAKILTAGILQMEYQSHKLRIFNSCLSESTP